MQPIAPVTALALFLLTGGAHAQAADTTAPPPTERRPEYSTSHPVALGLRLPARAGEYLEAGIGGQIRVRPHRLVVIEGFLDNFAGSTNGMFRHDHEVGSTLQLTALGGPRWNVYPMLGACAMWSVIDPSQAGAPSVSDIRFGIHAGIGGEYQVWRGVSLDAQIESVTYVGHDIEAYAWTATVSPDLRIMPVGQLVLGVNYYL